MRSTLAGHVEKWEMKNWKEGRYPENRGEMEAGKKSEIAIGNCIKRDLERVGKLETLLKDGIGDCRQRTQ